MASSRGNPRKGLTTPKQTGKRAFMTLDDETKSKIIADALKRRELGGAQPIMPWNKPFKELREEIESDPIRKFMTILYQTDVPCPNCKANLYVMRMTLSPLGGGVYCDCGYRDGLTSFLGKQLFPVQQMEMPNKPIYWTRDESSDD